MVHNSGTLAFQAVSRNYQRINSGAKHHYNTRLTKLVTSVFTIITWITWLANFLLCSGDVHPNPGPLSTPSTISCASSSSTATTSILDTPNPNHHLSLQCAKHITKTWHSTNRTLRTRHTGVFRNMAPCCSRYGWPIFPIFQKTGLMTGMWVRCSMWQNA